MNKHEKRSIESYDKKALNYDETFDGRFTVSFKDELIKTVVVQENGNVLDVACGNGRFLHSLSEKYSFIGFGTDISNKMVEAAKLLNPDMKFVSANCEQMPFESGTMDVITVCAAFHHFPNVSKFAQEAHRVMKKNGIIYIAEVYYPAFIRTIVNPFVPLSKAGDVKFYSPKEIQNTLQNAGFKLDNFYRERNIQIAIAIK